MERSTHRPRSCCGKSTQDRAFLRATHHSSEICESGMETICLGLVSSNMSACSQRYAAILE